MDNQVTERTYPIRNIWLFKQAIFTFVPFAVLIVVLFLLNSSDSQTRVTNANTHIFLSPYVFLFAIFTLVSVFTTALRRSRFHYSLEEKFIVLHQGIITKQNRNVAYGVIQGVFVNQSLFDRIFGLASLTFEDFSNHGRSAMSSSGSVKSGKSSREAIGFVGNKIHIPGLKKKDAEELKTVILQKIKENPIDDRNSGL